MTSGLRSGSWPSALWHTAAFCALVLVPGFAVFRAPFWSLPGQNGILILAFALAYLAAITLASVLSRRLDQAPALITAFVTFAGLSVVLLGLSLSPDRGYSRVFLVFASGLFVAGLCGRYLASMRVPVLLVGLVTLLGAMLVVGAIDGSPVNRGLGQLVAFVAGDDAPAGPETELLITNRITLSATYHRLSLGESAGRLRGGAIAVDPHGRGYLLASARGQVYRFDWDEQDQVQSEDLGYRVPHDFERFAADVGPEVDLSGFRVADLLALAEGPATRIYVSHHYWKPVDRCFVVRVSTLLIDTGEQATLDSSENWRTLYETSPCLPIKRARGAPFAGEQIGGNLEWFDSEHLLLTVGDHQFDGWYGTPDFVGDADADYGKTLVISLADGRASVFTTGHRNPQGLTIDAAGRIWETEHGPEGGDELNLLISGHDYGWPSHTYGTEYGSVTWPMAREAPDDARESDTPVFAWVPSIGISEVISVQDTAFSSWRGDLLIASLRGEALWRVRWEDGRVAYTEPIPVDRRVRDLVEGPRGELVLWTDRREVIRLQPARARDRGAALFATKCGGCHDDVEDRIGPTLAGVVGRRVADRADYDYSTSLRNVGGRWTEERLDAFISDPRSFAPGTAMASDGVSDPDQRSALIEYLKTLP